MMRKFLLLMVCLMMVLVGGCEYQNEEALFEQGGECSEEVDFATHIQPLIQKNCLLSGCHVAGGQSPELTSYEKVVAKAHNIMHETQSLQMPPPSSGKSLSIEEIDMIACWIEQGTK